MSSPVGDLKSASPTSPLARFGNYTERSIARYEVWYVAFALVVFALLFVYIACSRPLWFDEFFTLFISRLPSVPVMLKAIPADGQPPLQYVLTHLSLQLPGELEFVLRLPEVLAFLIAGLLTYVIVRRRGTATQALFAFAFFLSTGLDETFTAWTARPYCLLLMFTALTFLSWQSAASRPQNRVLPLCGVAFGISGALFSHHFGIFHVGTFLLAGESVRMLKRRRIDQGMLASMGLGFASLVFTLPLARRSRLLLGEAVLQSSNFWAKPRLVNIPFAYIRIIPGVLLLIGLVLVLGLLPWRLRTNGGSVTERFVPVPDHEWAATGALCLLPIAIWVVCRLETNYFLDKYAVGACLGFAILSGWGMPRMIRFRSLGLQVFSVATMGYLIFMATSAPRLLVSAPFWQSQPGSKVDLTLLVNAPTDSPIVVANAYEFAPDWWYSSPSLRKRLIYLSDVPYAEQQQDFLPEVSLAEDRKYIPLPVGSYDSFVAGHKSFLLLRSGFPRLNWTESRLARAGWRLSIIAASDSNVLYKVEAPRARP